MLSLEIYAKMGTHLKELIILEKLKKCFRIFRVIVVAGAGAALILSLVPLLHLGFYARPALDDYSYGAPVHYSLEAGKGLFGALSAIWECIRYCFLDWQGTYTSIFLFCIQPGVFSTKLYFLTTWVFLSAIIGSVFLAVGTIRKMDRWSAAFLGIVLSFFTAQSLPSLADGLYWWNGAAHYIASWFVAVLTFCMQIRLTRGSGTGPRFTLMAVLTCLLGFLVGGQNPCSALVFPFASAFLTVLAIYEKRPKAVIAANLLTALFAAAGLLISVLAPGNAVRQAVWPNVLTPMESILISFQHTWEELVEFLDWKLLGALLLCIPVFLYGVRDSGYSFRFPPLILCGTFCLLAALHTPYVYAIREPDLPLPGRVKNLMYLATLFFVFGNVFYLAGWVMARFRLRDRRYGRPALGGIAAAGCVLFLTLNLTQLHSLNAYSAWKDLHSPVLTAYEEAWVSRKDVGESSARWQEAPPLPDNFRQLDIIDWQPAVLLDGKAIDLKLYWGQSIFKNYVELDHAQTVLGAAGKLTPSDIPGGFPVRGGYYVPLRKVCKKLNFDIQYLSEYDAVFLTTQQK